MIALGTFGMTTWFYDGLTGRHLWTTPKPLLPQSPDELAIISPDSSRLLTHSNSSRYFWARLSGMWLWDLSRRPPRRARRLMNPAPAFVHQVAFRPDGQQIVVGCGDGKARFWDVAANREAGQALPHASAVTAVAFSPDGRLVLTGCRDGTAHLWDAASRREQVDSLRHDSQVNAVAFSPNGRLLLTGSATDGARFWDRRSGRQLGPTLRHGDGVHSLCFHPDGRLIATGDGKRTARLWRVPPAPVSGTPRQLRRWVEAATGLELGERGTVQVMAPAALARRREQLRQSSWTPPE
jgi:WD40 repeat protein